jgi:hypothetical protein
MRSWKLSLFVSLLVAVAVPLHAQWTSSSGNTTTTDKVGVGTTSPAELLHVFSTADANLLIKVENASSTGAASAAVVKTFGDVASAFHASHGSGRTLSRFGVVLGGWNEFSGVTGNGMIVGTINNTPLLLGAANAEVMRLTNDGRVGIGTTTPASGVKLHVVGNAQFDGTVSGTFIKAQYQDVAEWVPSKDDLEPGTVVVLDPSAGNSVMASRHSYDTSVAGVVSSQPGIVLGQEGASKAKVATTGRVRVKVDASRGAIAVGDLLVTSDRPGLAMRSTPVEVAGIAMHRPGTIVGKALEPLASGEGEILVLLSLQ